MEDQKAAVNSSENVNRETNDKILELTKRIEAANEEFETFSRTVTHDLKAPLRAIAGFSRILTEEHSKQLDSEGLRVLGIIEKNAKHMTQLLDDLLLYTRISRTNTENTEIDMTLLSKSVFDELYSLTTNRKISLRLENLPSHEGDPALFRQVLTNLLSNAIKFTRNKDMAIITIGCIYSQEEKIYFVQDNGVGFDMKYSGKLFGIFQRLHTTDEFEGTGIGIAVVKKIINKFGGRVWIEAEPEKGATFYFSFPFAK